MTRGFVCVAASLALAACVSVPAAPPVTAPSVAAPSVAAPPAATPLSPLPNTPISPPSAAAADSEASLVRQAYAAEVLAGWRRPTAAELGPSRGAGEGVLATGDFNRDGAPDRAELLVNPATNEYAVFISSGAAPIRVLVGDPLPDVRSIYITGDQRGLALQVAGTTLTARWAGDRYVLQ